MDATQATAPSRPRLGFVGAGAMALGLARGIRAAGLAGAITAHDPVRERLDRFCAEVGAKSAVANCSYLRHRHQ